MLDNSEFAEVRNLYGHLQMFALTMISNSIIQVQGRQTRQRTVAGRCSGKVAVLRHGKNEIE